MISQEDPYGFTLKKTLKKRYLERSPEHKSGFTTSHEKQSLKSHSRNSSADKIGRIYYNLKNKVKDEDEGALEND